MTYDVAIVGAGIAGLYAGMKLARSGWSVCVVDRRSRIGAPVRCGQATGNRAELKRFVSVREEWIARDIAGLSAHINGNPAFSRAIPDTGVVLKRDLFEQYLATQGREAGMHLVLKKPVTGLLRRSDGRFEGLSLHDGSTVKAAIIVGADGCESKVGCWAGITRPLGAADAFTSAQYSVTTDFCDDGFLHFFVGSEIIPKGYIWVFPRSRGVMSVGAGLYGCHHRIPKAFLFLDRFMESRIPGAEASNLVTGCAPLAICPRRLSRDNVLVIGDAARQVNPLTAGGIMNTLEAADMAVGELVRSGRPTNNSVCPPAYSRKWRKSARRQQKLFYLFREIFLQLRDRDAENLLDAVSSIFAGPIDRSRPFAFPTIKLLRLLRLLLPGIARRIPILLR